MIFDFYAHYVKDMTKKHKFIQTFHAGEYEPFQRAAKRTGEIVLYLSPTGDETHAHAARKPALRVSSAGGKHISGLFFPDLDHASLAMGDFENDALLFMLSDREIEVLVSRNRKPFSNQLFSQLADGDPDLMDEVEGFRRQRH
jgi:hypothetical protein